MELVLMAIAAVCAYFVKGLCGFANTLVFSTILSFGINNVNISPVELLLGYPSNLILAWKERKAVDWKVSGPLALLVLLGNIPGIFILKHAGAQSIKIVFGFVIIAVGMEMLIREQITGNRDGTGRGSKVLLGCIGIVSGVLCGLYGIGALLAAYIGRVTDNSKALKANICLVFIVENTFRIIVYSVTGILTLQAGKQALLLVPAMLAGLIVGMKSSSRLNENIIKKIVVILLIFSGGALIINNI